MRIAPLISLALSILIGVLAVFFGRGWINNEADAGAASVAAIPQIVEVVETQKILVTDVYLERGDLLTVEALREEDWPADYVPVGALTDMDELVSAAGDWPRSVGVFVPGEPLLAEKLTYDAVRDTLAAIIEPGFRAVSINVNDASGVAGFVLPDHRVDVNLFEDRPHPQTGQQVQTAKTILENVRVLAVDQLFESDVEGVAIARTVTLQVLPEQAHALGIAVDKGRLGLALRPKGEQTLAAKPVVAVAPRPRVAAAKAPAKPKKQYADIRVIQGDNEETVRAPAISSNASQGESE